MRKSILFVLTFALATFARSTTLTYVGAGSDVVGNIYAYPYYLEVDGAAALPMMCLSYDNEIVAGESWSVTEAAPASIQGLEAAWLLQDAVDNPVNAGDDNLAAWGLVASDVPVTSGSIAQLTAAEGGYGSIDANDFVIYTPEAQLDIINGIGASVIPQTFIGLVATPEPSSLTMLGLGLGALAWGWRRSHLKEA